MTMQKLYLQQYQHKDCVTGETKQQRKERGERSLCSWDPGLGRGGQTQEEA